MSKEELSMMEFCKRGGSSKSRRKIRAAQRNAAIARAALKEKRAIKLP